MNLIHVENQRDHLDIFITRVADAMLATTGGYGDIARMDGQPFAILKHFATATEDDSNFLLAFVDMHANRAAWWDAHVSEYAAFAMEFIGL